MVINLAGAAVNVASQLTGGLIKTSSLPARLQQNAGWYNAVMQNDNAQRAANSLYNVGYGTAARQPSWQVGGPLILAEQAKDAKAKYDTLVQNGYIDGTGKVVIKTNADSGPSNVPNNTSNTTLGGSSLLTYGLIAVGAFLVFRLVKRGG